jgi:membrane-bound lytic murein transglycosylase B
MPHRILTLLAVTVLLNACTGRSPRAAAPSAAVAPPAATAGTKPSEPIPPVAAQPGIAERGEVRAFAAEMSRKHGFEAGELLRLFDQVPIQENILEAMAKPYEAKPWSAYRKLFLTEKRIQGGREFKATNAQALAEAQNRYGVAPEVVTAIIGIESSYGQKPGKHRVIDALSTLAFAYPKRADFFRRELEQFLLLCREEGMPPLKPEGSYAGAMGMPQFMPSSYRKLAADGDHDGKRDIWNNPADAIASVARYLAANGWRTGEPMASPAVLASHYSGPIVRNPKPVRPLHDLIRLGVTPEAGLPGQLKATVLELGGERDSCCWVVFHNFSVIMRYNHSPLYAMAATELSRELAAP